MSRRELPGPAADSAGQPPAPRGETVPEFRLEGIVEEGTDLRDVWEVMRRRRWLVLGTLAAVLALVGSWTMFQTPLWRASTLIRVDESGKSDVAVLDVLAALQRGSEIETEMRILRTRPILEEVVDALDLNLVLTRPRDVPRSKLFTEFEFDRRTSEARYEVQRVGEGRWLVESAGRGVERIRSEFNAGERVSLPGGSFVLAAPGGAGTSVDARNFPSSIRFETLLFADAVDQLEKVLEVTRPDREANVVHVAFEATDRELAVLVPNALAESFIRQRQEVQKTEVRSTVAFLEEQSDLLRQQLEAAERQLQEFREGRQIVALGVEAEEQVKRLAELQSERTQLDAERTALANLVREVDAAERPDYRRLAAFPTFLRNEAIADILQQLTASDRALTQLLSRLTAAHPDVTAVERQIEILEAQLGDIGRNYLRSLNDQIASLDAVLGRFGSELEEIPAKEVQYARLERQTRLLGELYTLLQTRLKEAEVAAAVEDPTVRVVERAVPPREPVRPRPLRNLALAGVLGLMLGIGLAFSRDYLDTRVHSTDDVEALFGLPSIARIPVLTGVNGGGRDGEVLVTTACGHSVGAEAFRILRTNVRFVRGGEGANEIVITSAGPREGKSVTAANLASALAQQGYRTVLVDADLRRSVQHVHFGVEREPGLSSVLAGQADLDRAIVTTRVAGLDVLPAGPHPPNPAELLGSPRMSDVLAQLRDRYDCRVFDTPPALAVTDASVLGRRVEGVVLVVRAEQTDREAADLAISQLRHVGAAVLGIVLNDARADGVYSYYRRYYGADDEKRTLRRLLPG